jgi:uncharacterized Zn-binding protein involved in type VI secretion
MSRPAAAWQDSFECPLTTPVPHGRGEIALGAPEVFIHDRRAARFLDKARCSGDPRTNFIVGGVIEVLIHGLGAARQGEKLFHGGTVLTGAADVLIGGASVEGWTIEAVRDILCAHDPGFVQQLQRSGFPVQTMGPGAGYTEAYWDGTSWKERNVFVQGFGGDAIQVGIAQSDESAVNSLYHEHYHVSHDHDFSPRNEYETEVATEQWAIDHGLPEGRPGFRKYDPSTGKWVVDRDAVKTWVENNIGPIDPPPGAPPGTEAPWPIGHDHATGETILNTETRRPPQEGDFHEVPGSTRTATTLDVPVEWFKCP